MRTAQRTLRNPDVAEVNEHSVTTAVDTAQIASMILNVLGIAPTEIKAVRAEGTLALPGF